MTMIGRAVCTQTGAHKQKYSDNLVNLVVFEVIYLSIYFLVVIKLLVKASVEI